MKVCWRVVMLVLYVMGRVFNCLHLKLQLKLIIVEFLLSLDEINVNDISYKNRGFGHGGSRNNLSIIAAAVEHWNLEILEMLLKSPRIDKHKINYTKTSGNNFQNTEVYYNSSQYLENQDVIKLLARYGIKWFSFIDVNWLIKLLQ